MNGSLRLDCKQLNGDCSCKSGVFGSKCDSCPFGEILTESGCIPNVIDDYNRLLPSQQVTEWSVNGNSSLSGLTLTTTTTTTTTTESVNHNVEINSKTVNSVNDLLTTGKRKKKRKGLGRKKNRKNKKSKLFKNEETTSDVSDGVVTADSAFNISRRSHEMTDAQVEDANFPIGRKEKGEQQQQQQQGEKSEKINSLANQLVRGEKSILYPHQNE